MLSGGGVFKLDIGKNPGHQRKDKPSTPGDGWYLVGMVSNSRANWEYSKVRSNFRPHTLFSHPCQDGNKSVLLVTDLPVKFNAFLFGFSIQNAAEFPKL